MVSLMLNLVCYNDYNKMNRIYSVYYNPYNWSEDIAGELKGVAFPEHYSSSAQTNTQFGYKGYPSYKASDKINVIFFFKINT